MGIKESHLYFATVGGTYIDFAYLDLTPWRIQGGLVESTKTKEFIESISMPDMGDRNWKHVKNVSQSSDGMGGSGMHGDWKYMNLLWPLDFKKTPSEADYFEVIGAIKVIHPSEVYIFNILGAQYFDQKGIYFSGWSTFDHYHWHKYQNPEKHYFICPKEHIQETNAFLAFYKETFKKRDYIRNAINTI